MNKLYKESKDHEVYYMILGMGEAIDTLHTLSLLKQVLPVFPQNSVKTVCETILKVMTLSNVVCTQPFLFI
jgi:hypothetical protein